MPAPYSLDLRRKAMEKLEAGWNMTKTSKVFNLQEDFI